MSLAKMSLRVKSHTDLQTAGKTSLDEGLCKSLSVSSSNISRGARFGNGTSLEVKGLSTTLRRPVRAVRPVSTVTSGGSFLQMNHLQGELVRKRKVRRWSRLWSVLMPWEVKRSQRHRRWWRSSIICLSKKHAGGVSSCFD